MFAKTMKWIGGGLVAVFAVSVVPAQGRAEFVPAAVRAGNLFLSPGTVMAERDCSEGEAEMIEQSADLREIQLAMLYLLIGNVPAVNLNVSTYTTTGGTVATGGTTLPGGSDSSSGDPTLPATTPEPATWLLGMIGSSLAGLAGALRVALRA
jgi:hypothetical protein